MFPHNTEYDGLSHDELLHKTNQLFEFLQTEKIKYDTVFKQYEERIDDILGTDADSKVDAFFSLLQEADFIWCCEYSFDFSMLTVFQTIITMEIKLELPCSLLQMHSLSDAVTCYTKTVFYFRRMEFDFPLEDQLEICELMDQYRLSPIYFYVILKNALLDRRKKIATQLSNIYTCLEEPKWAAFFARYQ